MDLLHSKVQDRLEERHHGNYEGAVGGWGGGISVGRPARAKGHNWWGSVSESFSNLLLI